jgi:hypothetical protein
MLVSCRFTCAQREGRVKMTDFLSMEGENDRVFVHDIAKRHVTK